jgi:phospholipid N-methyltransferase
MLRNTMLFADFLEKLTDLTLTELPLESVELKEHRAWLEKVLLRFSMRKLVQIWIGSMHDSLRTNCI